MVEQAAPPLEFDHVIHIPLPQVFTRPVGPHLQELREGPRPYLQKTFL